MKEKDDIESMLVDFSKNPNQREATRLNGEKVVIDVDKIIEENGELSEYFIEFLKDNEGRVFTAQTDEDIKNMYSLKESEFWLFAGNHLIEVE